MTERTEPLVCKTTREWEAWLAQHYGESEGVWLLIAKKGSSAAAITIAEALDGALCFGWIDSQRKGHDATTYLQRYSPRRATSPWSKLNVERVKALTAGGRMRPPGLAEVARAKRDGRWAVAYASQRNATLPADFLAALSADPRAKIAFASLAKTDRYLLLLPVLKATTLQMRAARLRKAISTLSSAATASSAGKGKALGPTKRKRKGR
ncbi:MAG: YdeI/OmpD-associated family protein [Opitutus sp.]